MMPAPPVAAPPATLADAVRAGRWVEVRSLVAQMPALPPAVALVAARAERSCGDPGRARAILRAALPRAGELAGALRIELAVTARELGQSPLPDLEPLLSRVTPSAQRRTATDLLRETWETLPVETLRQQRRRPLPRALRNELEAAIAVRGQDQVLARKVLGRSESGRAATRVAAWLAALPNLPEPTKLEVARALLTGGFWREAREVLASVPAPAQAEARITWAYLSGRAAYRMGDWVAAATWYDRVLAEAVRPVARFEAAVQRARVAEITGDWAAALGFWTVARTAGPAEPEGWDGTTRALVAQGRSAEAVSLIGQAPAPIVRAMGCRLAASLLAHGEPRQARAVLGKLSRAQGCVRALWAEVYRQENAGVLVAAEVAALLADPHAGPWRELAIDLLPTAPQSAARVEPTRDVKTLATIATTWGAAQARQALTLALAQDGTWAPLLAGTVRPPTSWHGPAADLAALGLELEAARLYPHSFPSSTPEELAWSGATLARWDNREAALGVGETLWTRIGVPACLVPDALLPHLLPATLVSGCAQAAAAASAPKPWLFGILRQESRFNQHARSQAGAMGVAQLVPETLRRLGVSPQEASAEAVAMGLAAREISRLSQAFGPRLAVVAAAYNAGDPVTGSWLAALGPGVSELTFAAAVPYRETSGYVLAVWEGASLARHLT